MFLSNNHIRHIVEDYSSNKAGIPLLQFLCLLFQLAARVLLYVPSCRKVNTSQHLSHQLQPVLHDWCNKGCGVFCSVNGMMYIKEPYIIGKSSPCGGSGFPLSLSKWSFIICLMPYNCK